MSASISFEVRLASPHAAAVERVMEALKSEGFGVLTRVDLHDAFEERLGVKFRRYSILGACNPQLAHRALSAAPEVGLLLPCNITVEETPEDRGSLVRIINAHEMMKAGRLEGDEVISAVATAASERLRRVADALAK